ncbi:MAG: DEAD/DEAH box helicase, partial [Planctomycetes bacterium]|nr:DEAD/DEAH box helicase [Planctomycetota bacterium]
MDVDAFLSSVERDPAYAGQIVHVHTEPARPARWGSMPAGLHPQSGEFLAALGVERLYTHQAEAIGALLATEDALITTGAASGKSLCYQVPILEALLEDPESTAILLFPTKALARDQVAAWNRGLQAVSTSRSQAAAYDGDAGQADRRAARNSANVIVTNPEMLHLQLLPNHGRWARLFRNLRFVVLDEVHTYTGFFGANMANVMRRLQRVCEHHGSRPQMVCCSATVGSPTEVAELVTGRRLHHVAEDGAPHGAKTYVFWNPPRIKRRRWRGRRSANVEAHELMVKLIRERIATITFSKARNTAEMIYRYVRETLQVEEPELADRVVPYRGGYSPEERREMERRLRHGELLGVSTTAALELGIDVGSLEACIIVGYPGLLSAFFQQAGRAGRTEEDSLVILVGIDTAINQYVMTHPEYIFGRPIEHGVIDPDNPFVVTGHLRCATHELPLDDAETATFGPHAEMVLRVLEGNLKVKRIRDRWYHSASETPQHEVSLRDYADANVVIEDVDTGAVLGEVNKFDAPPILHPGAIYMHLGDTYEVQDLDLEKNIATVKRVEVDYYTQPLGGTDVHHVDLRLREKAFGTGMAYWGEVTAYFDTAMYEKVHFYSLDAISRHGVELPTFVLETMALWIVPPEDLMERVRQADLDAHSGLRGIG